MPDPYNDNYSIVPHSSLPEVLLLHEDAGWTLLRYTAIMPVEINAALQA